MRIIPRKHALSFALLTAVLAASFTACVPARQVEELKEKYDKCETERMAFSSEKENLETELNELKREREEDVKRLDALQQDTTVMGTSLRKMQRQYDKINRLNDELLSKLADLQKGTEAENRKLLSELQQLQEDLQKQEDELRMLERELNVRQKELQQTESALAEREKRVKELEELLAQKDQKVKDLKTRISEALTKFEGNGLTVEQRNGKIYVSMEAKLLFDKGSTSVDKRGKEVLVGLATALEDQQDIEVLVEGHTDSDPLSGTGTIKDNWDLSVMRATSVVRIMLENSNLQSTKVTAAGRGEHMPVDPRDTEEAKAKNRRIEVILTPNLDELFEIIESE